MPDAPQPQHYGYVYRTDIPTVGAYYIGQHRGKFSTSYYGSGIHMLNYLKKYGSKGLTVTLLAWADSQEELNALELELLGDKYKTDPNCWNLRAGGMQPGCSYETRKKLHLAGLGKVNPMLGRKHTEESKLKMRLAKQEKSNTALGKHYFNNGEINVVTAVCPEGFVPGMIIPKVKKVFRRFVEEEN